MKIEVDFSKIHRAKEAAFKDMAEIMSGEFTKAITSPTWDWPTGGKRDIVDTGRLRISQVKKVGGLTATYAWPTEYAVAVHNGYISRNGRSWPARPWTDLAVKNQPPLKLFKKLVKL